jgi:hypothetical protein
VVTALVTSHPSRGLWAALAVLVIAGAGLQVAVTYSERRGRRVAASGPGAVAIGGSARGKIRTRVHQSHATATAPADDQGGVTASGPGAVSVGGDARAVSTDVTADNPKQS